MTRFTCMECFKTLDDKLIKWHNDTQMCAKCYGKRIIYDLLRKDIGVDERQKLDLELMEVMELVTDGD